MKRSTELSRWQWQCEWQCLNADCVQDFSLETLLRDAHQYKTLDLSNKQLNEIPNEVHTHPSIQPPIQPSIQPSVRPSVHPMLC